MTALLPGLAAQHAAFAELQPRLERTAIARFRYLRPCDRDEALSEALAFGWKWFQSLWSQSKDARTFPASFTHWILQHVRSGRRLCSAARQNDVLSPFAQRRHRFNVERIDRAKKAPGAWREAIVCSRGASVPDQAVFSADYPEWLLRWSDRDRQILAAMIAGERTMDIAARFRLTPGRISQLRRAYHRDWRLYQRELPARERQAA